MLAEFLLAAAAAAAPRPTTPRLSPEEIGAALEYGKTAQPQYLRAIGQLAGTGDACVSATTPVMRVARLSAQAAREYRTVTPRQVPADITRLELWVEADPIQSGGMSFLEAKVIVMVPQGTHDPASAVRPTRQAFELSSYQNAFGARGSARTMTAVFPMTAVKDGHEIRVVFGGTADECVLNLNSVLMYTPDPAPASSVP